MSNVLDRKRAEAPQPEALREAAVEAIFTLRGHLRPKAREKAKASLEAYAARLERDPWTGLPNNVLVLHATERQREEDRARRAKRAAALRHLIGECF